MPFFVPRGWLAAALSLGLSAAAFADAPVVFSGGVVNAADYTHSISPGMIIAVFGTGLAPGTDQAPSIPLPTVLDGVSVEVVDGSNVIQAPLFFISAGQINAQLPFETASSSVQVRVRNGQGVSNSEPVAVTQRSPSLFTRTMDGKGEAIVLHANYTPVSTTAPAKPGEVVILYLTGLGAVSPAAPSGRAGGDGSAAAPLNLVMDDVAVLINGEPAVVDFKGLAPYFVGLYQINFHVPAEVVPGNAGITVQAGGNASGNDVAFAITLPLDSPAASSLTPAGGTVSAGGVTIVAPAGAVTQSTPLTLYRSGTGYAIAGLSGGTTAPITITVDLPAGANTAGDAYLALRQLNGPEEFVKATIIGTRISATFPAMPALTSSQISPERAVTPQLARPRGAATPEDLASLLILDIILGDSTWTPGKGRFEFIYNRGDWTIDQGHLAALTDGLDAAFDALVQAFPDWKPDLPIDVYIQPLHQQRSELCRGETFGSLASRKYSLRIWPRLVASDWWPKYDLRTYPDSAYKNAFHLLFHYVTQSLYGRAVTLSGPYPSLWLDEAAAMAFQFPDPAHPIEGPYLADVYGYPAEGDGVAVDRHTGWGSLKFRQHGFGASRFIAWTAFRDWGGVYAALYAPGSTETTEHALEDALLALGTGLDSRWTDYCNSLILDVFAPDMEWKGLSGNLPAMQHAVGSNLGLLAPPPGKDVVFYASLPDLSAKLFWLQLPAQLPQGYDLVLTVSGVSDVAASVYYVPPSLNVDQSCRLGAGASIRVSNLKAKLQDVRWLAIVLLSGHLSDETTSQQATVTVGFRSSLLPLLHEDNYIEFNISGTFACDTTLPVCPSTSQAAGAISAFNLYVVDPSAQPVPFEPPGWVTEFSIANDESSARYAQTYTIDVTLSDAGDEILDAKVSYSATEPLGKSDSERIDKVFEIQHVKIASAAAAAQVFKVTGPAAAQALTSLSWTDTATGKVDGKASGVSFGPNEGITITFKNCSSASTCR